MTDHFVSFLDDIWEKFPTFAEKENTDLTNHNLLWSLDEYRKANYVNFKTGKKELYRLSILLENYAEKHYTPLLATFETEARYKYVEKRYLEILKSLRSHGWSRDLKDNKILSKKYKNIDKNWIFINSGFNLRTTDVNASIGLEQLKRIKKILSIRKYNFLGEEESFKIGIEIVKKLTKGTVHLNLKSSAESSSVLTGAQGVQVNQISGPHPAGNVGVQIHHLDPINKGETVWTLTPQSVVLIGRYFNTGKFDLSKLVALTGSEVSNPQYYKVISGAQVSSITNGNISSENVRYVSGNALSGSKVENDSFVSFYDNQLTVLPEGNDLIFFGSFLPSSERLSFGRSLGLMSFLNKIVSPKKEYVLNTNINGEHRAFVQSGVFEQVLPMDIYPVHLLKAILAEDFDEMEALGIYEVAEEDFALCEFVDVSKNDVQAIIRSGLDLMQNS